MYDSDVVKEGIKMGKNRAGGLATNESYVSLKATTNCLLLICRPILNIKSRHA